MSLICPVPKTANPVALNDFRLIALTLIIMKCFEKNNLHHLLEQKEGKLDSAVCIQEERGSRRCHVITSS